MKNCQRRLRLDFHKRDTNDIRLSRVANGNAEIDNDGNVERAREGRDRIFSRPIIYERFPKCNTPATQRRRDRSFFYSCRRARDASSGRKTRRPASGH